MSSAVARVALVLVFVALAAAVAFASPRGRRRRISALIGYAVLVSLGIGLSGREAWPFSQWPMDNSLLPRDFRFLVAMVVDSAGTEFDVDPRAFEPAPWVDLSSWIEQMRQTDPSRIDSVAPWMLGQLREARIRVAQGGDVGTYRRWLGFFAAPGTQLDPTHWAKGRTLPTNIAALRLYEVRTNLDAPATSTMQTKQLMAEYRLP